jgi:glucan phosphoethanolaminetransferase (alkaline phosphatase superfamily)
VSTDQYPAEGTSPRPSMPASVRVAIIVMGVLAALLLTNAALLWFAYDDAVARLVQEGEDISRDEASQFVLMSLVPYLVIGLVLALAAWFLPRRLPWARWMGLAASGLLALLSLMSAVSIGGVTIPLLLVLVLSVAAVTSLLARTTGTWIPKLRSPA